MPLLACPQLQPLTSAALQKATCPRQLTQTRHRKHPPLCKSNMPPPTHPHRPPPTSTSPQKTHSFATNPHMQPQTPASPQKKHAPACLPKPATANRRRFAKSNMTPQTHPKPKPPTSAALQKQHAPACLPTPATANKRLSAKEACPCLLAKTRNR